MNQRSTWNVFSVHYIMKTSEIAAKLGGELTGNPDIEITGVASYSNVLENQLTFLTAPDPDVFESVNRSCCILIPRNTNFPADLTCISVDNPKHAFAVITPELLDQLRPSGIHESFVIGEESVVDARYVGNNVTVGKRSRIAEGVELHDGVSIGNDVVIGAGTIIYPNTVVYDGCQIGEDCVFHAGVVIGAAGFGYVRKEEDIVRFPQIGTVVIENNVEIGANSCVDRGALGETRIGSDTKIDNLVQIAHNVTIGRRVVMAAFVGISGSVVIEDDVVIGGQVGIADHVTIRKGAVIGARSAVFPGKIVRAGVWAGSPIQPIAKYKEQNALMRSLARLRNEIIEIKEKLG